MCFTLYRRKTIILHVAFFRSIFDFCCCCVPFFGANAHQVWIGWGAYVRIPTKVSLHACWRGFAKAVGLGAEKALFIYIYIILVYADLLTRNNVYYRKFNGQTVH